eukprot:6229680-Alexandrium_andersonii.AAC.1
MSASLVGSEMCIRDSPSHGRQPAGQSLPRNARGQARGNAPKFAHKTKAVSYTHLTLPTICSV